MFVAVFIILIRGKYVIENFSKVDVEGPVIQQKLTCDKVIK